MTKKGGCQGTPLLKAGIDFRYRAAAPSVTGEVETVDGEVAVR